MNPAGTLGQGAWHGMPKTSAALGRIARGRSCGRNPYVLTATLHFDDPGWMEWTQVAYLESDGHQICAYRASPVHLYLLSPALVEDDQGGVPLVHANGNSWWYMAEILFSASGSEPVTFGPGGFAKAGGQAKIVDFGFRVSWRFTATSISATTETD